MKINAYNPNYNVDLSGATGLIASSATYAHTALGSNTPLVESGSGSPGTGPQASAWNHVHPALAGSTSFGSNSNSVGTANSAGASSSNSRADHIHKGVSSIAKSGSTALVGDITLTGGSNVTLTQSGQDISIAASASGGSGSLTYIGTQTLGADAATFDYGSIPGSYKDLIVIAYMRGTAAATTADVRMRVGTGGTPDTGANYSEHSVGSGTTGFNVVGDSNTSCYIMPAAGATATAGYFTAIQVTILDYTSTSNRRHIIGETLYGDNTARLWMSVRCTWKNSASAIDIIRFFPDSNNIKAGSRILLYGRG